MRVNKNLLINNDKLTNPSYEKDKSKVFFKDGRIYFNDVNSYISNMTISGSVEKLSEDIDPNSTYYVGAYGKSDKNLKIYMGEHYKIAKTIGDFHYIEIKGDKIKGAIYILSNEGANGYVYGLGAYKNYPSEMYMPNIKSLEPSKQAIFISGGYSKTYTQSSFKDGRFRPVRIFGGWVC